MPHPEAALPEWLHYETGGSGLMGEGVWGEQGGVRNMANMLQMVLSVKKYK